MGMERITVGSIITIFKFGLLGLVAGNFIFAVITLVGWLVGLAHMTTSFEFFLKSVIALILSGVVASIGKMFTSKK